MSFSVDLWNGFDIIKSSFSGTQKKVKLILDIMTSYANAQKEYYKSLDILHKELRESKEIPTTNTLFDDSINLLINSFKAESELLKCFYNNLTKNINELKENLEKIKLEIVPYFTEHLQNKEGFEHSLSLLIAKQEEYNKSLKEYYFVLAEEEAHKIMSNRKSYRNNKKELEKEKEINRKEDKSKSKDFTYYKNVLTKNIKQYLSNNSLKDSMFENVVRAKKEYLKIIDEIDKERQNYNTKQENLLNNLQKQYKLLVFIFQSALNKYITFKTNTFNAIKELNELNDKEKYSKINYKNETYELIMNNATKEFPMNKLEFIPYKITKCVITKKLSKFSELTEDDENKIFNLVKADVINHHININENEFLMQSFIIKNKIGRIKRMRRATSSGMLPVKKPSGKQLDDNSSVKTTGNKNKLASNLKTNKHKDDLMLNKENEKKSNCNFINDFISKLISSKNDNDMNELPEISSYQDIEEADEDANTAINKKVYIYNELLFTFMDLIDVFNKEHNEYLDFFIKVLNIHRSKGNFILNENSFKIMVFIFNYILVNFQTANNLIKNIILLSQTFYKLDQDNKIYILSGLKNHTVFNNVETWHRAINYNLSLSIKSSNTFNLNIENKNEYLKNLDKVILNVIISYLYDLKLSTNNQFVYERVKKFYVTVYKLDEKFVESEVNKLLGEINIINEDMNVKENVENQKINEAEEGEEI